MLNNSYKYAKLPPTAARATATDKINAWEISKIVQSWRIQLQEQAWWRWAIRRIKGILFPPLKNLTPKMPHLSQETGLTVFFYCEQHSLLPSFPALSWLLISSPSSWAPMTISSCLVLISSTCWGLHSQPALSPKFLMHVPKWRLSISTWLLQRISKLSESNTEL